MGKRAHDVWVQQKQQQLAGTLSPHMNQPFTADQVIVSGVEPIVNTSCPKCNAPIQKGAKFCHNCGASLASE